MSGLGERAVGKALRRVPPHPLGGGGQGEVVARGAGRCDSRASAPRSCTALQTYLTLSLSFQ